MTRREEITNKARAFLEGEPEGLRYSVLVKRLVEALPQIPPNTIHGTVWNLDAKHPDEFYKPAKGVFRHVKFKDGEPQAPEVPAVPKIKEEDFYASFAEYLVKELEECSKAIVVGGNKFKDKWGTPDVLGVLRPKPTDIFPFPTEIVAAEVKLDYAGLITAFGQACAYKLFPHKSYIVVPASAQQADISRLDSLCMIFGIGLIVFESTNPKEPNFQIMTRAVRHEPDMFYVNKNVREVADELLS
jgi:hypothetical protein